MRTIGAGVGQQGHLIGYDGTIALDPGFHAQNLWMARAAAAKLLGTRKFQLHRAVGSHGEDSADVFEQDLLLDAKTTADARLDDANPTWGQADNRRDNTADVVRYLRAGAHHQAIIFVPVGNDDMIFDRGLLHLWNDVLAFYHHV